MATKQKIWVGLPKTGNREVFKFDGTPTETTHGETYLAVIGPFRTMRGAKFMADYGGNGNPHIQCVADAERTAKERT